MYNGYDQKYQEGGWPSYPQSQASPPPPAYGYPSAQPPQPSYQQQPYQQAPHQQVPYQSQPPPQPYGQQQIYGPPPGQQPYATSSAPSQPYPPPQQQQPSVTFRFMGGSGKIPILNSTVTDSFGRQVFTLDSPDKKQTLLRDMNGRVIAAIDWKHDSPRMEYQGRQMKIKEFMPIDKKKTMRTMHHNGQLYEWREQRLWTPSGVPVASWRNAGMVEIEITPEGQKSGLVESAILGVILMNSDHPFGDVHGSGGISYAALGMGGVIGQLLN